MNKGKYIVYSTVLAIFSDRLLVRFGGVTLYYFYFMLLVNLAILLLRGWRWLPRKMVFFLGYLACSGILGLALGTNSLAGFVKAYSGIFVCSLYFAAFLRYVRFDVRHCFELYAKLAFYAAAFGILYFPFQTFAQGRLTSVMLEPSSFCLVCLPAAFFYADEWQRTRRHGYRCLVLFVALLLTLSSGGILSALFGCYLFGRRYRFGSVAAPVLILALGTAAYRYIPLFQLRVDDAAFALAAADVSNINASTFGTVENFFIVERSFQEQPVLGGGLGSHVVAHARFVESIPGVYQLEESEAGQEIVSLGQWDASSMFLRIVSELGLVGLIASMWFLRHYWPLGGSAADRGLAMSVLCWVFLKFLRSGGYFTPEVFFFLSVYVVNGVQARAKTKQRVRSVAPAPAAFLPAATGAA